MKAIDVLLGIAIAFSPVFSCRSSAVEVSSPQESVDQIIRRAGNDHDEAERLRLLRQLEARTDLESSLRADLGKVMPTVLDWADGKARIQPDTSRAAENSYLCRFIDSRVRPQADGPIYPPALSDGSPLRPIWCLYRGRMLIWRVIQSGPLLRVKESREAYYGEARTLLEEAGKAFPENRIIRMYLGEPIPWPGSYQALPEAPEWVNLQREGLEKLADVIHWWIAERQLADGQFGGGWGDDVEMWRWWTDRVMSFTGNYLRYVPGQVPPAPSPEILYSTATGDPGNPLVFPLNAVRWRTEPRQIAALVTDSGPDRFEAELFHFGTQARPMGAEWYLLRPGRYQVTLVEQASGRQVSTQGMEVVGPRCSARFELPARVLCVLRIRPADR